MAQNSRRTDSKWKRFYRYRGRIGRERPWRPSSSVDRNDGGGIMCILMMAPSVRPRPVLSSEGVCRLTNCRSRSSGVPARLCIDLAPVALRSAHCSCRVRDSHSSCCRLWDRAHDRLRWRLSHLAVSTWSRLYHERVSTRSARVNGECNGEVPGAARDG